MPALKYQQTTDNSDSESEDSINVSDTSSDVSEEEYTLDTEEEIKLSSAFKAKDNKTNTLTTTLESDSEEDEDEDEVIDTDLDLNETSDIEEEDEDEDLSGSDDEGKTSSKKYTKKLTSSSSGIQSGGGDEDEDEDEDEDDDDYLQKFNEDINKNFIADNHPECINVNFDEVLTLSKVVRDGKNNIVDDLHRTLPYLTKYEKTRILGQRAKQINSGMTAFVKVPENVIDGYLIAEMELAQKRIPFIIKRPVPGGGCEYWRVSDLELVAF
jgi:DNA-directed RNA polymerase I, II, and III subunit RPABC2